MFNLAEKIIFNFNQSDKVAYLFKEEMITRGELKQKVELLATSFSNRGVTESDRVILLMDDTPAFVIVFLALTAIGANPVPINPKLKPESVRYIFEDSRACLAILETRELTIIEDILKDSTYLRENKIILQDLYNVDSIDVNSRFEIASLKAMLEEQDTPSDFTYYLKKAESIAFWQYTSGTTGQPKAVQHTQQGMISNTELFARDTLGIDENDVLYSIPKMFFGYGLGNSFFFPLYLGATVVLDAEWPSPSRVVENIIKYKPTVLFGVPAIYNALLDVDDEAFFDAVKNIRVFFSAGSCLPAALFNRWKSKFGKVIYDGIGATEVGHVFLSNYNKSVKPGATGLPVAGYEVRLETKNKKAPSIGKRGVLHVRGPSVTTGYWEKNALNFQKIKNGWYRTGDIFSVDADGYYVYQGREDDLFKVNGRWIVPNELESKISEKFAGVKEVVLVGRTNKSSLMEQPVLFLSMHVSAENIVMDIKKYVESKFEHYKHPADYIVLEELPKNDNGKLMRNALVNMVET